MKVNLKGQMHCNCAVILFHTFNFPLKMTRDPCDNKIGFPSSPLLWDEKSHLITIIHQIDLIKPQALYHASNDTER